jgi:hypothetical protein
MLDKLFIKTLNNTRSIPSIALSLGLIIFCLRILLGFYIEGIFELSMFIFLGSIGVEKYVDQKYSDNIIKPQKFICFDNVIETLSSWLIIFLFIALTYSVYQDKIITDPTFSFWENFFRIDYTSIFWLLIICYILFRYKKNLLSKKCK